MKMISLSRFLNTSLMLRLLKRVITRYITATVTAVRLPRHLSSLYIILNFAIMIYPFY